ncbi:MAG: hypothetical protein QOK83_00460, partial [Nitrososphaeraceae archaeon]|nr:hypothetical protein [Nitrososphaeraceae archaeon]
AGQEAQDSKPSITFKLDEDETAANTDAKLAQDSKPSITFKLDEEAASSSNSKVNPLAGQEAQEPQVKPATTTKIDDNPPADDDKPMLLSEEQVKQEQGKPAMTTKVDDSPASEDKPISLNEETSGKDKSATLSDTSGRSNAKELGTTDSSSSNVMSDEDSEGKIVSTNLRDPFAPLN